MRKMEMESLKSRGGSILRLAAPRLSTIFKTAGATKVHVSDTLLVSPNEETKTREAREEDDVPMSNKRCQPDNVPVPGV